MAEPEVAAGVLRERREILVPDDDLPARRAVETGDEMQERALPRAARPDDGDELAGRHREVHVSQRVHGRSAVAVALAHTFQADADRGRHPYSHRRATPGSSRAARRAGAMPARTVTAAAMIASAKSDPYATWGSSTQPTR